MRNLKRALCFALAAVMVLGLMITGAGAASTYDNFTDKDEIVHQEAVNTMVSLGVISGKEDGSYFDPTATVTRAEMTKVVAVALNGGKDPVFSDNDKTTFSDTQGHWAEKYIAYCVRQNIVAGRGDNSFGPDDPLTGSACAKMFLCALGYRADLEGFVNVGDKWELNVNVKANQDANLYNGLSGIKASDALTRDSMAQMLYNAVQANEVIYDNLYGDYSGVIQAKANGTMLWNRFQVRKVTGILEANDKVSVANDYSYKIGSETFTGNAAKAVALEGRSLLRVTGVSGYNADSTGGSNSIAGNLFGGHSYKVATSDEMVGQEVVIYVQFQDYLSPNSNNAVVIGEAILTDNNTVVETNKRLKDEAAVRSALRDGGMTGVNKDTVTAVYSEKEVSISKVGATAGITDTLTGRSGDEKERSAGIVQRFIDNSGDGVADYVIQTIPVLTNVNSVSTSSNNYTFTGITGSIPNSDVISEETLARGDIILITRYADDNYYVEQPETVEGTVESYNTNNNTVSVEGTSYANSGGKKLATNGVDQFLEEEMVDNTYILYLDPCGNVLGYQETDTIVGNYCVVRGVSLSGSSKMSWTAKVKVIMQDGTVGTYEVNLAATAVRLGLAESNATTAQKETALTSGTKYFAGNEDQHDELMDHLFSYTIDKDIITLSRPYYVNADRYTSNRIVSGSLTTTANLADSVTAISKNDAQYLTVGGDKITANDNTVFFIKDQRGGDSDYYAVKGLSRLPATSDNGSKKEAGIPVDGVSETISYTAPGSNAKIARAIFVETDNVFRSARDFSFVTNKYTYSGAGSTPVYTFDVVNTDGEVSKMTTTSEPGSVKNTVREHYQDGSYITFEGPKADNRYTYDNVYVKEWDGKTVTLYDIDSNTFVGSFRVDNGADIWDVQNDPAESDLSVNDKVGVKLTGENVVEAAFIYGVMEGAYPAAPAILATDSNHSPSPSTATPGNTLATTAGNAVSIKITPAADTAVKGLKINGTAASLGNPDSNGAYTVSYTVPADAYTGDEIVVSLTVTQSGMDDLDVTFDPITLNLDTGTAPTTLTLNVTGAGTASNSGELIGAPAPIQVTGAVADTTQIAITGATTYTIDGAGVDTTTSAYTVVDGDLGKTITIVANGSGWTRKYEVEIIALTNEESGEPLSIIVGVEDKTDNDATITLSQNKDLLKGSVSITDAAATDVMTVTVTGADGWNYTCKIKGTVRTSYDLVDGDLESTVAVVVDGIGNGKSWNGSYTISVAAPVDPFTLDGSDAGTTPAAIAAAFSDVNNTAGTVTITGNFAPSSPIAVPANKTLTVEGNYAPTAAETITGTLVVGGDYTPNGGAVTLGGDASLDVTGTTTGNVTANTTGTVTLGDLTGNLTVTAATSVEAGDVSGTLNVATGKSATVASANAYTTVAGANVTVTGDITTATLGAGTYVLQGNVTGALTLNAASKVTFAESINLGTVLPTSPAGAEVTFTVAPTNLTVTNNSADGFFSNDGSAVLSAVGDIATGAAYRLTANTCGGSNAGWVKV